MLFPKIIIEIEEVGEKFITCLARYFLCSFISIHFSIDNYVCLLLNAFVVSKYGKKSLICFNYKAYLYVSWLVCWSDSWKER